MSWYSIQNQEEVTRISITGEIDPYAQAADELFQAIQESKTVEAYFDSVGGDSETGFSIALALRSKPSTAIIRRAYSAAAFAAMGARKICVYSDGRMMLHAPSILILAPAKELRRHATDLDALTKEITWLIQFRSGASEETVNAWLSRDTWFDSQQALDAHLVDETIEAPKVDLALVAALAACEPTQTQDEKTFWEILRAFDRLGVRDRQSFGQNLHVWLATKVYETNTR